jgi:hypothetical protein
MPMINHVLRRLKLGEILERHLPAQDGRTKVPTVAGLLLLVRNVLISRKPIYGVADWACPYAPDLLGLSERQLAALNDDRLGRCLDGLFATLGPELLLDVVRHAVGEFHLRLDELHNDSTSISFYGQYADAAQQRSRRDPVRPPSADAVWSVGRSRYRDVGAGDAGRRRVSAAHQPAADER